MIRFLIAAILSLCATCCFAESRTSLTPEQQSWVSKGKRSDRAGWIYLHTEGEPRPRGFQHGFLLAKEIADGLRVTRAVWEHESAMEWQWLVGRAVPMFLPKIDPEDLAEIDGIAEGARAAGIPISRDELITCNSILELSDYWWPAELKKIKAAPSTPVRESCSSFIATGSWTKDGGVVLGHNTMQSY
ncbi:MAG: hypothetical protein QOJ40_3074, partial [Verrucomicrobiota bacterium]